MVTCRGLFVDTVLFAQIPLVTSNRRLRLNFDVVSCLRFGRMVYC